MLHSILRPVLCPPGSWLKDLPLWSSPRRNTGLVCCTRAPGFVGFASIIRSTVYRVRILRKAKIMFGWLFRRPLLKEPFDQWDKTNQVRFCFLVSFWAAKCPLLPDPDFLVAEILSSIHCIVSYLRFQISDTHTVLRTLYRNFQVGLSSQEALLSCDAE